MYWLIVAAKQLKKMSDTTLAVLFAKFCSVKLSTTTWKTVRNQKKCKHTSTSENMQIIYFKTQALTISLIPPFTLCCTHGRPWQVLGTMQDLGARTFEQSCYDATVLGQPYWGLFDEDVLAK